MNASWLPHWTTLLALGCGLAGAFYPKPPPDSQETRPRDFQEKHVEAMARIVIYSLFVLSLVGLGILNLIFLAVGWSRSHWAWSVAGAGSLLWITGRLILLWHRLPVRKGALPPPVNPAPPQTLAETAKPGKLVDDERGSH